LLNERLSAFVNKLLQPIAKEQESYLQDSTDFINFREKTRVPERAVLVSHTQIDLKRRG